MTSPTGWGHLERRSSEVASVRAVGTALQLAVSGYRSATFLRVGSAGLASEPLPGAAGTSSTNGDGQQTRSSRRKDCR